MLLYVVVLKSQAWQISFKNYAEIQEHLQILGAAWQSGPFEDADCRTLAVPCLVSAEKSTI